MDWADAGKVIASVGVLIAAFVAIINVTTSMRSRKDTALKQTFEILDKINSVKADDAEMQRLSEAWRKRAITDAEQAVVSSSWGVSFSTPVRFAIIVMGVLFIGGVFVADEVYLKIASCIYGVLFLLIAAAEYWSNRKLRKVLGNLHKRNLASREERIRLLGEPGTIQSPGPGNDADNQHVNDSGADQVAHQEPSSGQ